MGNSTKEVRMYILLQIILVVLVLVVFAYVAILIKYTNEGKYVEVASSDSNVANETNAVEINTSVNSQTNEEVTIPVVKDNVSAQTQNTKVETNNKYFYNQLNDNARLIYEAVEQNAGNLKSGQYTIELSSNVSDILKQEGGDAKLNTNFQSAWDAIGLDKPDLFYVDISKVNMIVTKTSFAMVTNYKLSMQPKDNSGYLLDEIFNGAVVEKMVSEIESKKKEIISSLSGSDYDKILKVHNWLVDNVEYDQTVSKDNIYNLYGALVSKSAVCEGYAEAFKYIMDSIGIPCVLVVGTATNSNGATENHEWNYVKLDGNWYGVDCTWDDPIITGGGKLTDSVRYKYFLKGANTMNQNHQPSGRITSQGMEFIYPTLSTSDYKK